MELKCPKIYRDGKYLAYGGNPEWFPGTFQRRAGCGSVTGTNIAVCEGLFSEEVENSESIPHESYLELMEGMYQYMTPGFMGYPLIGKFKKDFLSFASDRGKKLKARSMFLPRNRQDCLDFIKEGLYHGHPTALLIWRHSRKEFREDNWHWVTITGYDEEREILIWSNCGEREEIPVKVLLDDSARYYIGLVRFEENN